jgi:phosphatidylglycerol:prolipoprotein diacylglycerol transferase
MLKYPEWLSPDIVQVGNLRVRWYGMMYLIGFFLGRVFCRKLSRAGFVRLSFDLIDDFLVAIFIGMLLGARALYLLVYFKPTPEDPLRWYTPFAVWQGGLAFHGAVIGMVLALCWFSRRHKIHFWSLTDTLALAGAPGIIFGRIGNFINSELVGRVTNHPWAMQFPVRIDGDIVGFTEPRHPSQLYEAFGEGLIPFIVIWLLKPYIRHYGVLGGIWLCTYAVARCLIEFTREKDAQLEYLFGWITMGQVLSAAMLLAGLGVCIWCSRFGHIISSPVTSQQNEEAAVSPPD